MLKAISKLWQKAAKRLAKAQLAQQKKLLKKAQKTLTKKVSSAPKKKPAKLAGSAAARGNATAAKSGPKPVAASSAAPATPEAGGSWKRAVFTVAATAIHVKPRSLTYWLFFPTMTSNSKLPLIVMLHGCDQNATDFATGTRMNALGARHGFAVLYPQQSVRSHAQRCWPWYKRTLQQGEDEVALIAGIIDTVISRGNVDPSRIYIAGLSAGAALAQILALRLPHMFAAVGSHSGPVYGIADSRLSAFAVMQQGSFDAKRPVQQLLVGRPDFPRMPIIILQGSQDKVVRPVNANQLVQQFCLLNRLSAGEVVVAQHPARGTRDACTTTDYRQGRLTIVRLCEVAHLGHAWSGGDPALRYNAAAGPDASALLWDFFKRHRCLPVQASSLSR